MHPAPSVILFTVLSGAGFGLIFLIGLGIPVPHGALYPLFICGLAGVVSVAGLLFSTFHLGRPERAWRAVTQWRTSWLSREGVFAILTLLVFALYALAWQFMGIRLMTLGLLSSILAFFTVYSTAMIYAQLKTVPAWSGGTTRSCFLLFSLASGALLGGAAGLYAYVPSHIVAIGITAALIAAWIAKASWWRHADNAGFSATGSDAGTATGLGTIGAVRLLERPHTGENYLTREMVYKVGRKHAARLRRIAMLAGATVPIAIAVSAALTGIYSAMMLLAFASLMIGLLAERWLFFAEAKHSVSLYY